MPDRPERLGPVRRVRDAQDRRRVFVEVDARAGELGWAASGPVAGDAAEVLRRYDDRQPTAVRGFLNGVLEAARGTDRAVHRRSTPSHTASSSADT